MPNDFRTLLWLMKIGTLINVYLIFRLLSIDTPDFHVVLPALILLSVSAFRCLFPNRYLENIVFHDNPLSSIFLTRFLATFSEVAYIYQFSYVIRILNVEQIGWIDGLSWVMVIQVVISQGFVWSAILTKRLDLYFYEELGWFIIFFANTAASAFLYFATDVPVEGHFLLILNLFFGAGYLPWQVIHLRSLHAEAGVGVATEPERASWRQGLHEAMQQRNRRTDARAWGGTIGLTWMVAYWATLIPWWVEHVASVVSTL